MIQSGSFFHWSLIFELSIFLAPSSHIASVLAPYDGSRTWKPFLNEVNSGVWLGKLGPSPPTKLRNQEIKELK